MSATSPTVRPVVTPAPKTGTRWYSIYLHLKMHPGGTTQCIAVHLYPVSYPTKRAAHYSQSLVARQTVERYSLPTATGVYGGQFITVECRRGEDPIERARAAKLIP